ncbi:hypothetical protein AB0D59_04760 [Streptomyces sp. NPDC048417]|uniref:hypothetical protein n=1 Tax=Streptomyces sp. NPDC048417 TaxID=3155387 RepID=UPI003415AA1A
MSEQEAAATDSAERASGPAHLGHAAPEIRVASRGEAPFAWLVSEGFEPRNWMVFLTVLLGWHADGFAGVGWGVFAAVFTAVVPTVILGFGERHNYWGDRQVRDRQDRVVAAPGVLASVIVGTALLFVLGAPSEVSALVAAMLAVLLALMVITFSWKVSVHSAVAACAVVILVSVFGPWACLLVPVVPLIGWSRIRLRCHTAAQVTVGAVMGAAVGGVAFGVLR